MIVVVEKYNAHKYSHLIEKMYRLRAHVFHDRLGWDVQVVDGKERDKYDDEEPVYMIHTDDKAREVKGSLRLLPTTGSQLFSQSVLLIRFRMLRVSVLRQSGRPLGFVSMTDCLIQDF